MFFVLYVSVFQECSAGVTIALSVVCKWSPQFTCSWPNNFADCTNLFYEHKDLKTFSALVNQELQKNNEWFKANELALNVGKTKYPLFDKPGKLES